MALPLTRQKLPRCTAAGAAETPPLPRCALAKNGIAAGAAENAAKLRTALRTVSAPHLPRLALPLTRQKTRHFVTPRMARHTVTASTPRMALPPRCRAPPRMARHTVTGTAARHGIERRRIAPLWRVAGPQDSAALPLSLRPLRGLTLDGAAATSPRWSLRSLRGSPCRRSRLVTPAHLHDVARHFARHFCAALLRACQDPVAALPAWHFCRAAPVAVDAVAVAPVAVAVAPVAVVVACPLARPAAGRGEHSPAPLSAATRCPVPVLPLLPSCVLFFWCIAAAR